MRDVGSQPKQPEVDARLWVRWEYLYTQFLCFKLLITCNEQYRNGLIEKSHEILSLMLGAMRNRRWLVGNRNDIEWVVSACDEFFALRLKADSV